MDSDVRKRFETWTLNTGKEYDLPQDVNLGTDTVGTNGVTRNLIVSICIH